VAKTYTAPTTVSAGDALTASLYNTYVGTNIANLIVPPSVKLQKTTTQSITNASETALTWPTAVYDTDSMYSAVNTSRITINTPGIYVLTACATFASNGTGERLLYFRVNGDSANRLAFARAFANQSGSSGLVIATSVQLSAATYIEVAAYQSSGGALNVLGDVYEVASFSAVWVGRTS
jgi:hypothetical protein